VEWPLKANPADMAFDPADRAFERFEIVEFDPHALTNCWALNKLDLASFRRQVENANAKGMDARPPETDLG
jgi:hypothetical protein